jgi:hypothetical protein
MESVAPTVAATPLVVTFQMDDREMLEAWKADVGRRGIWRDVVFGVGIVWLSVPAIESSDWTTLGVTPFLVGIWWLLGSRWLMSYFMRRLVKGCSTTTHLTIRDDVIIEETEALHPNPKHCTQRRDQYAWSDIRKTEPFWKGLRVEYHGGRQLYIPDSAFATDDDRQAVWHRAEASVKK